VEVAAVNSRRPLQWAPVKRVVPLNRVPAKLPERRAVLLRSRSATVARSRLTYVLASVPARRAAAQVGLQQLDRGGAGLRGGPGAGRVLPHRDGWSGAAQVGAEAVNRGLAQGSVTLGEVVELVQHRGRGPIVGGGGQAGEVVGEDLAASRPSSADAGVQRSRDGPGYNRSGGGQRETHQGDGHAVLPWWAAVAPSAPEALGPVCRDPARARG
jgi:hypothetical protein